MKIEHYNRNKKRDTQSLEDFLNNIKNIQLKKDIIQMLKNGLINASQAKQLVKQTVNIEYIF